LNRKESPKTSPSIPLITRFEIWLKVNARLIPDMAMMHMSRILANAIRSMLTCIAPILLETFVNAYEVIDQQKAVASAAISPM